MTQQLCSTPLTNAFGQTLNLSEADSSGCRRWAVNTWSIHTHTPNNKWLCQYTYT
ncbi:hypothetical protein CORC01_05613 [Colletotrichum orchidophilum]|uniref:Uncharacterized protein n=1 Tax=Colletotrichum orchidophilum TaxID=1209926 RepID=A0A1G4BCN0_9PEZI|nr:uncharacterized protein CORC01_05613 [Colletotrichum orchidophilum]OHE99120.1 hypothetical protein CORC01_05613 [Colletotrichum orchidophilum]